MLNLIGKFLYNYGWIILVAMVMAFKFYRTYKQKGKEALMQELRESLYALFLEAEKRYGKGDGATKLKWVIDKFIPMLPRSMIVVIGEDHIEDFVQKTYLKLKDKLDDGKINGSI